MSQLIRDDPFEIVPQTNGFAAIAFFYILHNALAINLINLFSKQLS